MVIIKLVMKSILAFHAAFLSMVILLPAQGSIWSANSNGAAEDPQEQATRSLANLVAVVQAYNALPETARGQAGSPSVRGAYELLSTQAEKHPDLELTGEVSIMMEWALMLTESGKLRSAPLLNSVVEENMAFATAAKIKRNAQTLASVYNAASATGSAELDDVKTTGEAIEKITVGVKGAGAFAGLPFVAKVTKEDAATAMAYLEYDPSEKILRYHAERKPKVETPSTATDAVEVLAQMIKEKSGEKRTTVSVDQRTAQSLASIYNAAIAAGTKDLDDAKTLDEVIKRLKVGVLGSGPFEGKTFVMPITPEQGARAQRHLKLDLENGLLEYLPVATAAPVESQAPRRVVEKKKVVTPEGEARRDAQTLYSTYLSAKHGGCTKIKEAETVAEVHAMLAKGVFGGGPWQDAKFSVVISKSEMDAAAPFLKMDADMGLIYLE